MTFSFSYYTIELCFVTNKYMNSLAQQLAAHLSAVVSAMEKSVEVGCTDHLDCCEDGGAFWYDALDEAKSLLDELRVKHGS